MDFEGPTPLSTKVIRESIGERRKFWFRLTNRAINEVPSCPLRVVIFNDTPK